MKRSKYISNGLLLLTMGIVVSCSQEEVPIYSEPVTDAVEFTCTTQNSNLQTRAGEEEEDIWLEMPFNTWKWDGTPIDFYIHQQVTDKDGSSTNLSTYNLKQGEIGRLEPKEGQPTLKWISNDAQHIFYSWTKPEGVTMQAGQETETGSVDMSKKNLDYEYFVGTDKTGPMTYGEQGVTVGLRYKHLISKIVIDRITLIRSDGTINSKIWGSVRSIMFPNMPIKGIFTTGISAGAKEMKVEHSIQPEDKGITFKMDDYKDYVAAGMDTIKIPFYLLPQSFIEPEGNENGRFYVALNHENGEIRMYEGNLNTLYNADDETQKLDHIEAGECLTIRLILQDDEVHGIYTYVRNWNTAESGTVKDKPYPGIGSAAEILSNYSYVGPKTYKLNETFLDGLVYEEVDEKKVVRLCDNIDLIGNIDPEITLVIPDGYVLDGCNMNINCPTGLKLAGEYRNVYINGEGPKSSSSGSQP